MHEMYEINEMKTTVSTAGACVYRISDVLRQDTAYLQGEAKGSLSLTKADSQS